MMTSECFSQWLDTIAQCVETRLTTLLTPHQTKSTLIEAMSYATLNGGKRLRPAVMYAITKASPNTPSTTLEVACCIELIHCYSLVHDDLPCMDNDSMRRNRPACHIVYGEAMALLAGDCLQSLAFQTLANTELPSFAYALLANRIGFQGMGEGQALDICNEKTMDKEMLNKLITLKTGCLFDSACQLALLCSPTENQQQINILSKFGYQFGRLFQIVNDIQDQEKDAALGKITYATHPQYDAPTEAQTQQQQLLDLLGNHFPRLTDMTLSIYTP